MADVDSRKERVDSGDVGLALLGFASGSMDALAFFNLGEVFPSAMTGNTALLGLALGQGHVIAASRPFVAFEAGGANDRSDPAGPASAIRRQCEGIRDHRAAAG